MKVIRVSIIVLIGCLLIGCGQIKDDSISNEAVNTQTADNIDIVEVNIVGQFSRQKICHFIMNLC